MPRQKTPDLEALLDTEEGPRILPISSLRFDPQNPRIVEYLGEKPTQDQMESLLLDAMKAVELIPSFVENGYIPYEPLVVREKGKTHEVIEGNRRLAALKAMQKSDEDQVKTAFITHKLDKAPCLVFKGDDKQLLAYLGLRHLSKTKDWEASAKGAFVERVLNAGYDLNQASRLTSTSTSALRLILLTRRMFEQARDLGFELDSRGAESETFFWHLGDTIRRTKAKIYLSLEEAEDPLEKPTYDESKFENLVTWLYGDSRKGRDQGRVINSIRDIKRLVDCIDNERARERLENGGTLAEAEEEMEAAGAAIENHLYRARKSVERATGGGWSELDDNGLKKVEGATKQLQDAFKTLNGILKLNRERLNDQDAK
jgi:ParB-like chromosome segregation protein Spo0J